MRECVLATENEFDKAREIFISSEHFNIRRAPSAENILTEFILANNCRAVILGVDVYIGPLYEALGRTGGKRGAVIARYGVGHDGINKELVCRHNIMVTNTPVVLDRSVAEHTLCLLGTVARKIVRLDAEFRGGNFGGNAGLELFGKTLGIIGFGSIGRLVARMAHFGFGMKVAATDVLSPPELENRLGKSLNEIKIEFGLEEYVNNAEAVLKKADVITLHLPSLPETRHFINSARLAMMKPAAILINTARGPIVDERALYDSLAEDRLAGAGLDVFEREPYVPVEPQKDLRKLKNVVLTPHIASNTAESNQRMARCCLENIRNFMDDRLDRLARI